MRSIFDILHKNFQEDQLNSRRFPGFPGGFLNLSRFPGFPGVVDTLEYGGHSSTWLILWTLYCRHEGTEGMVRAIYTVSQKKTRPPFYVCDNAVRCHPILPILDRNIPQRNFIRNKYIICILHSQKISNA